MKCEKCNKNEATFHSMTNINGKVTEKHLCSDCAKEEKEFNNFNDEFLGFNKKSNSFFDDMMSDFKNRKWKWETKYNLSYFTNPMIDNFLDYDDFFESPLFLEDKKQESKKTEEQSNKVSKTDLSKKLSEKEKKQLEIAKLDLSLKKAVVEERYEDAIKLRDKIKELKKDNK